MFTSRSRLTSGLVLASIALLVSALVASTSAGATGTSGSPATATPTGSIETSRNYYGAISLATTGGAVGWSYDYRTKKKAKKRAQRECKSESSTPSSCRKIAWVRNGCLAVAVRWSGTNIARYGWAVRRKKGAAYRAALDECGANCVKRAYTCTTR